MARRGEVDDCADGHWNSVWQQVHGRFSLSSNRGELLRFANRSPFIHDFPELSIVFHPCSALPDHEGRHDAADDGGRSKRFQRDHGAAPGSDAREQFHVACTHSAYVAKWQQKHHADESAEQAVSQFGKTALDETVCPSANYERESQPVRDFQNHAVDDSSNDKDNRHEPDGPVFGDALKESVHGDFPVFLRPSRP